MALLQSKKSRALRDEPDDVVRDRAPTTELDVLSRALSRRAGEHGDADVSIARAFVELHIAP